MDRIVPITMKVSSLQINLGELLSSHHDAGGIGPGVQVGLNVQSLAGSRGGDQLDKDCEAGQRVAAPVAGEVPEEEGKGGQVLYFASLLF